MHRLGNWRKMEFMAKKHSTSAHSFDGFIHGRFQAIPADPGARFYRPVLAAGAVLWRGEKIAVIHRPRYNDWSLPKGKVDRGENMVNAAMREITEETGLAVQLGAMVGCVNYPVKKNTKVVFYWNATVTGGEFSADTTDGEVDELRWLAPEQAIELVSYAADRAVITAATQRRQQVASTVLLVRHADAGDRSLWAGKDSLRPLSTVGMRQAKALSKLLRAYQPTQVFSAKPDRCVATVTPLAERLGVKISRDGLLGDRGWLATHKASVEAYRSIIAQGGVSVVCAQGAVIPGIVSLLAQGSQVMLPVVPAKKGSVWALSFDAAGTLVAADYLESTAPVV